MWIIVDDSITSKIVPWSKKYYIQYTLYSRDIQYRYDVMFNKDYEHFYKSVLKNNLFVPFPKTVIAIRLILLILISSQI